MKHHRPRPGESYMGQHVRAHKSHITPHSIINRLFTTPARISEKFAALPREEFADVSFYQKVINWLIMRSKAQKVIIRAGQNLWVDIRFITNYVRAKQAGMLRGIYWFFDGRASPGAQAALLVSFIQNDKPELGVWIDWERNYGGAHEGLRNVVAMMQEVERLLPGVEVGIYTGYYFFVENSNMITHRAQYAYLKTKKLWLAFYAPLADVRVPSLWPNGMTYWQKGTPSVGREWGVETIEIDMNEDMDSDPDPLPIPLPIGETMQGTVKTLTNIRNAPGATISGSDIGDLHERDIVTWDKGQLVGSVIWYHLTNATRNGQPIITVGGLNVSQRADCWAYGVNIEPIGEPAPTERTITGGIINFSDGTNEELIPKP